MAQDTRSGIKLVNDSGYPFQIIIEELIKNNQAPGPLHWQILAHEHHWIHPLTGKGEYIDLIIDDGNLRMVIECKRSLFKEWLFLIPDKCATQTRRSRNYWRVALGEGRSKGDWFDFITMNDQSYESEYCNKPDDRQLSLEVITSLDSHIKKTYNIFASGSSLPWEL